MYDRQIKHFITFTSTRSAKRMTSFDIKIKLLISHKNGMDMFINNL